MELGVSVCMVTYNQDKYINQAVESVMSQEAPFPIKLYIADDCSTDKTRELCKGLKEKYPDKIELILNPNNQGTLKNFCNALTQCFLSGLKYIALLDGDDYWTDSLKLKKQVDFLEANPDFAISFHAIKTVNESRPDSPPALLKTEQQEVSTFEDLCLGNYIYTATCVFRNGIIKELPAWYYECPLGDWPLHLMNAEHGKIKYSDEAMAVYRIHGGGMWSQLGGINLELKCLKVISLCINHFDKKYEALFLKGAIPKYMRLVKLYRKVNPFKALAASFKLVPLRKYDTVMLPKGRILKLFITGK